MAQYNEGLMSKSPLEAIAKTVVTESSWNWQYIKILS